MAKREVKKIHNEVIDAVGLAVGSRLRIRKAEYEKLASEAVFSGKVADRLNAIKSKGALEELDIIALRLRDEIAELYGLNDDSKRKV